MEILLDNPLATMYGPYFLVLYGFVIFFSVVGLAIAKQRLDQTDRLSIPPIPATIDPYEIAFLRGGDNELARSVVFGLVQQGFLEIDTDAKPNVIRRTAVAPTATGLTSIDQLALGWHGSSREPKEIFGANGLAGQLTKEISKYRNRLEGQQMLVGDADRKTFGWIRGLVFCIIAGLGAYKFLVALMNGYSNVFLIPIFLVVGLIIAHSAGRSARITKLGKTYLERLQTAFDGLRYTAQGGSTVGGEKPAVPATSFAGVDPLLLSVGVFGGAILAGTAFDSYNRAFQRSNVGTDGGGSCGSAGCGSCSSGSGDGGGSCGGGCGGCGGGD